MFLTQKQRSLVVTRHDIHTKNIEQNPYCRKYTNEKQQNLDYVIYIMTKPSKLKKV